MPANSETQALLAEIAQWEFPPISKLNPTKVREVNEIFLRFSHAREAIAQVENRSIPGPAGEIPLRIYTPAGQAPFPVLVYFHGGGWVIGNLEMEESICRTLANRADCVVVSVDYRLAPEHLFPAAAEDAYAATLWVANHAAELNADRDRLAVGGESAGGNLAAVVAQMARDRQSLSLVYQLLFYPVIQYRFDTPSYRQNSKYYLLTKPLMKWFWDCYLTSAADGKNPYASPMFAKTLHNLPPALIITAELDILRDEAELYGDRLQAAGVPVKISRYNGTIHGFVNLAKKLPQGLSALEEASTALSAAFKA
ncbi:alpha/beta hydrolase [Phormidium sp. CCY1219]|uniref:alpha/beta hydrolase n=1 Tax=Phormidium sp. CCY1219 TaxID=2886104 RepID=UPI002D1F62E8|nr:alpha/beta hydrolase [Phormidium sp. CCY1219]MEB3830874.1 alpha/beta hydrolase [Phormidium sp. CCY1219]